MEFSLDESYDDDYSVVEDAIMNEAKLSQAEKNDIMARSGRKNWANKLDDDLRHQHAMDRWHDVKPSSRPNEHIKQYGHGQRSLKERLQDFKKSTTKGKGIWDLVNRSSGVNKLSGLKK